MQSPTTYTFSSNSLSNSKRYVLPRVVSILDRIRSEFELQRVFDVGCGNGSTCQALHERGFEVTGIDPSSTGISIAKESFPHLKIEEGSAYDDLKGIYGTYPVVISLEVIEHLYDPRLMLERCFELLEDSGYLLMSTPYHGYLKNLALAVTGKMDAHFTVLKDDMHIKFFSIKTLSIMLEEKGFHVLEVYREGRIPPFAGSMVVLAQKHLKAQG